MRYLLALALASLAVSARADGPAVSALNGKVSVESGVTGTSRQSSATGTAQGAITLPVGHSFGFELDALASTSNSSFTGGGLAQFFWRDPERGLVGPFAGLAGANGTRLALMGGEGQLFAPNFTLQGFGGYVDVSAGGPAPGGGGGLYGGHLTLYPGPNLALTVGARQIVGNAMGMARIELLPDITPRRNVSFFVNASAGDSETYRVTGGIRIYFGPDKSLIRRHREDDAMYDLLAEAFYNRVYVPWQMVQPFIPYTPWLY